jgi:Tfp pilus assembly protein PilO
VKTVRHSRWLTVAAIVLADLVVAFVGWTMLISPQRQQAATTADAVNVTLAEIQAAQVPTTPTDTTPKQPKQPAILTANLYRLAKAMPSSIDMPDLLLELDQVARAAGVSVLTIAPAPPTAATGYSVYPINLTVSGNFYTLSDLLYRLRRLVAVRDGSLDATGRLFSVSTLALIPTAASGRGNLLNASLTVDAYVYGVVPGAAGATTSTPAATTTTTTDTTTSSSGP